MLRLVKNLSLKATLFLLVGIFVTGLIGFGILSSSTLNLVKVNGPLYQQIVRDKDLLADVSPPVACLLETFLVAREMCDTEEESEVTSLIERYQELKAAYTARLDAWSQRSLHQAPRDVLLN